MASKSKSNKSLFNDSNLAAFVLSNNPEAFMMDRIDENRAILCDGSALYLVAVDQIPTTASRMFRLGTWAFNPGDVTSRLLHPSDPKTNKPLNPYRLRTLYDEICDKRVEPAKMTKWLNIENSEWFDSVGTTNYRLFQGDHGSSMLVNQRFLEPVDRFRVNWFFAWSGDHANPILLAAAQEASSVVAIIMPIRSLSDTQPMQDKEHEVIPECRVRRAMTLDSDKYDILEKGWWAKNDKPGLSSSGGATV